MGYGSYSFEISQKNFFQTWLPRVYFEISENLQTEPEQSLFVLAELSFINWIKYHGRIKSLHLFKQIFLLVEKKSSEINPDLVQFWKSTEAFYQLTVMLLKSE